MKKQNIIIAVVALLILVGVGVGVYFAVSKTSSTTGTKTYSSNGTRSGSLLDRLNKEIESGAYSKGKGEAAEATA